MNDGNNSKYIACKAKANEENDCDIYVDIPLSTVEGNTCSVGILYSDNDDEDKYKLCIDDNNLVTVNADNESRYFVDAMSKSTFIHEDNVPKDGHYYVIVNIKSGNVILNIKGKLYSTNENKNKNNIIF